MDFASYAKGDNCQIYPGAYIFPNVRLGNNVTVFPGAVIGRPPVSSGATSRIVSTAELLPVVIGDDCVIGAHAVIYMNVKIGARSMICDTACVREECEIGESTIVAMGVTINYRTKIGNRVKIMDNSHITGNVVIEDDVFVSTHVTLTNDNAMGRQPPAGHDWTAAGPTIRRFATIGQNASILPGVEVGRNAIVAAGAVVTRTVPPEVLVMGVPARMVRALRREELRS
ncbi:MAG: DapH/DapD/GlmU-related protein [Planctomycetota bacterium]